jgi:hypothetical protein
VSDLDEPTDEKYITFKRQDFLEWLSEISPDGYLDDVNALALPDAVVIRRQDSFASPCLLTYASMISMVGEHHPEPPIKAELLAIADYFQRQGELAGDEARGLPTL